MNERIEIGDATLHLSDCLDVLRTLQSASVHAVVTDPPAGIGFMGKAWDHHKGGRESWVAWMAEVAAECLRVLKPGGHALVWSIPRTSHWTATAWEDAGFEVRDRIAHVFGSGFPKSLDVSKAIDKAAGAQREVIASWAPVKRMIPGADQNATGSWIKDSGREFVPTITAAATDAAKQWQGWGTALKPAVEDWWLLRKPLDGTVAENTLRHGCGGLNIDGGRVDFCGESDKSAAKPGGKTTSHGAGSLAGPGAAQNSARSEFMSQQGPGRWPANLVHDGSDEVLACFPESNGQQGDVRGTEPSRTGAEGTNCYGEYGRIPAAARGDAGSAARFFYAAKPSRDDRGDGNTHPTVKGHELMRYLCRLVTPPRGIVLDPFMGSGSTGKAALSEGFRFIGIEREPDYFAIAQARVKDAGRQLLMPLEVHDGPQISLLESIE